MLKYNDGNYTTFTFHCLFDLNLRYPGYELRPFRFGVIDATQLTTGTGVSWLMYNKTYSWRLLDTQLYYLLDTKLDDLSTAIGNIDISVDLSGIEGLINQEINKIIVISNQLESLVDDTEPDEDITKWADQASVFESANDYLHNLEESLEGTIEDFTFPEVANQTAVSNVVGSFFSNELVLALTLSVMALMIVFLIL